MTTRRGYIAPRNDKIVWVRGVIDDADPEEVDGSPKYINNAVVTWELLDADTEDPEIALSTGVSLGTGNGIAMGESGTYLLTISRSIAVQDINWLHVIVTVPDGYVADLIARFDAMTRSGATPVT